MRRRTQLVRLLALVASIALLISACGGGGDGGDTGAGEDDGNGNGEQAAGGDLIVGTTDTVSSTDPAKIYDYYGSNIMQNAGNTLVGFEPGATEVSPQLAAEMPEVSDDGLTYTFTLRDDVVFHDGSEMTSEDVKFSLERSLNMNHPEGAAFLIAGISEIEAPDDTTVEITLEEPNITFLSRLAYTVATILPSDAYEAPDGELGEDEDPEEFVQEDFIGTGQYTIGEFREDESILLEANPDYWGDQPANERTLIQFFEDSSQLKAALEAGEVDVAYRTLDPQQRADLEGSDDIQIIDGEGASIRYIVINQNQEPFDDVEVRQAMAAAVDRERIVDEVLEGAAEPLYSMIPSGFDASEPLFEGTYGDADPEELLGDRETPVEIELWYSTDHYGDTEPSIAQNLERSLEESGAFDVELQSTEWAQFTEQAWPGEDGQYPSFLLGWYPDYFDADDYIEPFYDSGGFLGFYQSDEMDELITEEQQVTDPEDEARLETFSEIQQLAVEDVPLIPLYEEIPVVFAREGVSGVEETMDPVQIFRYGLISAGE